MPKKGEGYATTGLRVVFCIHRLHLIALVLLATRWLELEVGIWVGAPLFWVSTFGKKNFRFLITQFWKEFGASISYSSISEHPPVVFFQVFFLKLHWWKLNRSSSVAVVVWFEYGKPSTFQEWPRKWRRVWLNHACNHAAVHTGYVDGERPIIDETL